MKHSFIVALTLGLGSLALSAQAVADCAADSTVADVRKAFGKGQALERSGNKREALFAYVAAQDYTCDANPVERDAAQRAFTLAQELAPLAERAGDFAEAYELYEAGGWYARADQALISLLRQEPDNLQVHEKTRQVFGYRALEAFGINNAVRIAVAGSYRFDDALLQEVMDHPAKSAERALGREAAIFDEHYLKELVTVVRSQPRDPLDGAAWQRAQLSQQAFVARWQTDPIQASFESLELARAWTARIPDEELAGRMDARRRERMDERAAKLVESYPGAPQLLQSAREYYLRQSSPESAALERKVASVDAAALRQAAAAEKSGDLELAASYYEVAQQPDRAQGARELLAKNAQVKMAPALARAQAQAEQMKAAYADPARVEALRQQALAAQKEIAAQQAARSNSGNVGSAEALEKELGL